LLEGKHLSLRRPEDLLTVPRDPVDPFVGHHAVEAASAAQQVHGPFSAPGEELVIPRSSPKDVHRAVRPLIPECVQEEIASAAPDEPIPAKPAYDLVVTGVAREGIGTLLIGR
jgi:hypothetical protein